MGKETWTKDSELDAENTVESTISITYDHRDRVSVTKGKMTRLLIEAGYTLKDEDDG